MKYIIVILFSVCFTSYSAVAQKTPLGTTQGEVKTVVKFYPNPAVNFITFEFKEPVAPGSSLHVFSFLGRQVHQLSVNAQRMTLNVADYFRGVYVFQLRSPSGKIIETNKFQVNR